MAVYNGGFPMCYQPMYQPYTQPYTQMQNQPQNVAPVQQNGGFVRVQNENEARMYPVAPGNSVTFINENAPYCYTKPMKKLKESALPKKRKKLVWKKKPVLQKKNGSQRNRQSRKDLPARQRKNAKPKKRKRLV